MDNTIIIDGKTSVVTLSNIGSLEDLEVELEDLNEEADIEGVMEQIEAYAQSGEIDAETDVLRYKVINPEEIDYLALRDGTDEIEKDLESFGLKNVSLEALRDFIESSTIGDVLYLRKEEGNGHFEIAVENPKEEKVSFGYFDCALEIDAYEALQESYLDVVCDTILPDVAEVADGACNVDVFDFEPQLVSGELYKVVADSESGVKTLEKVDMPAFYFQAETPTDEF